MYLRPYRAITLFAYEQEVFFLHSQKLKLCVYSNISALKWLFYFAIDVYAKLVVGAVLVLGQKLFV